MRQDFAWMVRPTAQDAWASGKGAIVWLSFAFGLIGAGSYLVSLFLGGLVALTVSWAIVTILKNVAHLLHAKRPTTMWRMVLRPGSSWIARGTIITALFSAVGLIQVLTTIFLPGTATEAVFKILAGLLAVGIIGYEGLALAKTRAIPFWSSGLLPVVFLLWAVTVGFGFVLALNNANVEQVVISRVGAGLSAALLVCMALYLWGAVQAGETSAASAREVVAGSLAAVFWLLVILVGTVGPGVFLLYTGVTSAGISLAPAVLLFICQAVGSGAFVYCAFRAGKYRPVVD